VFDRSARVLLSLHCYSLLPFAPAARSSDEKPLFLHQQAKSDRHESALIFYPDSVCVCKPNPDCCYNQRQWNCIIAEFIAYD
jgi:hypothetical protein